MAWSRSHYWSWRIFQLKWKTTLQRTWASGFPGKYCMWSWRATTPSLEARHGDDLRKREADAWSKRRRRTSQLWRKICTHSWPDLTAERVTHRLNMESDLQSLFGLLCTAVLIDWDPAIPPPPRIWAHIRGRYWSASQDRRHLFVTPWSDSCSWSCGRHGCRRWRSHSVNITMTSEGSEGSTGSCLTIEGSVFYISWKADTETFKTQDRMMHWDATCCQVPGEKIRPHMVVYNSLTWARLGLSFPSMETILHNRSNIDGSCNL